MSCAVHCTTRQGRLKDKILLPGCHDDSTIFNTKILKRWRI